MRRFAMILVPLDDVAFAALPNLGSQLEHRLGAPRRPIERVVQRKGGGDGCGRQNSATAKRSGDSGLAATRRRAIVALRATAPVVGACGSMVVPAWPVRVQIHQPQSRRVAHRKIV
jgi:hypothetical protein